MDIGVPMGNSLRAKIGTNISEPKYPRVLAILFSALLSTCDEGDQENSMASSGASDGDDAVAPEELCQNSSMATFSLNGEELPVICSGGGYTWTVKPDSPDKPGSMVAWFRIYLENVEYNNKVMAKAALHCNTSHHEVLSPSLGKQGRWVPCFVIEISDDQEIIRMAHRVLGEEMLPDGPIGEGFLHYDVANEERFSGAFEFVAVEAMENQPNGELVGPIKGTFDVQPRIDHLEKP